LGHSPEDDVLGVLFEDGEGDEDKSKGKKGKGKRAARADQPRDPNTGQFIPQASGDGPGQEPGAQPEPPPGTEPEPEPDAGEKFTFGGETWESQEAAEQNFRSLRGTYRAKEREAQEANLRADTNWNAYEAWRADSQAKDARIAELEQQLSSGRGPDAGQPDRGNGQEQVNKEDILKNVDMDAYAYLVQKGGPAAGAEYLTNSIVEIVRDKMIPGEIAKLKEDLQNQLDSTIGPIQQDRQQAETVNAMAAAAHQLSQLQKADGSVAFPELRDPNQVEEVARVWAREAATEQEAQKRLNSLRNPHGLMNAIAFYRMVKGFSTPQPASTPAPTEQAGQDLPASPVAPGAAATVSSDPRGGFTPGARADGLTGIIAELDKADMLDEDLGFARNR
jgi:hypothetical protein